MPRRRRIGAGGIIFHVLNRSAKQIPLFEGSFDYAAFEEILFDAKERVPLKLLAYCLMPNHWHLIICPLEDSDLSRFMHWLTVTHAQRWHAFRSTSGTGCVYQGRFKAIPVQSDTHLLTACRYVERNPLRAHLVGDAAMWRWSSLWRRLNHCHRPVLDPWPVQPPSNWLDVVNQPQTEGELESIRVAISRGAPLGCAGWKCDVARTLALESSLRRRGRPLKKTTPDPFFTNGGPYR
jgi:REP-associated tyrosine transposase